MEEAIKRWYFSSPEVGLSTTQRMYSKVKKDFPKATLKEVQKVMDKLSVFTKHKQRYKKRKEEERMIVTGPFEVFQMDLAFFKSYRGYIGILICIDCFSRFTWAIKIKSKKGKEIASALENIFDHAGAAPQKLLNDYGTEFLNQNVKEVLQKHRTTQVFSLSYHKAMMVERQIRSFRQVLRKKLEAEGSKAWPTWLEWVLDVLNSRRHSATGKSPNQVGVDNANEVFRKLYPYLAKRSQPPRARKPHFTIGQPVRALLPPQTFQKGDLSRTSDKIYLIARILFHPTIRYRIRDYDTKEIITGSYNSSELIPVTLPQV